MTDEGIETCAQQGENPELGKKAVFIRTYGCQMNEYDSRKLAKILEPSHIQVASPERADVILVNTCSVRDKPEQKIYSLLGELRQLKQKNPNVLIGVGGCVAQQEGEQIAKRSSAVDFVFGTHNLSLVPTLIERRRQGWPLQIAVNYRSDWEELPLGFVDSENRTTAFVAISRGCNKNCTYCIVPRTRGPEVSRAMDEIEKEVRIAVHRGAREVMLLGQTVNSYGLDFSPRSSFLKLLERLSLIENLRRIRFTSPHPQEVKRDFIDFLADNEKICKHIHMPLQSGSDRILKAMNRNYRRARYLSIIEQIKSKIPDIAVTTDIIVGFPGESEEDFSQTMEVLEAVSFDNSFSFMFSPRPGTAAANLPGAISDNEKSERLQRLQARQAQITQSRLNSWIGKRVEILLDGRSQYNEELLQGRMSQFFVVNLNAPSAELKPGMFIEADIVSAGRQSLHGQTINCER